MTLRLTAAPSGTVVSIPLTVEQAVDPAVTRTSLVALLPVHLNRLLPSTLIAYVQQEGGGRPEGTVEFREGGAEGPVVATVPVRSGLATYRLGTLSRGTHSYTAVFVPADPDAAATSSSRSVNVRVLR